MPQLGGAVQFWTKWAASRCGRWATGLREKAAPSQHRATPPSLDAMGVLASHQDWIGKWCAIEMVPECSRDLNFVIAGRLIASGVPLHQAVLNYCIVSDRLAACKRMIARTIRIHVSCALRSSLIRCLAARKAAWKSA